MPACPNAPPPPPPGHIKPCCLPGCQHCCLTLPASHPPTHPTTHPPTHTHTHSDGCFISKGYDATTHFETTVEDVLAIYKRITGVTGWREWLRGVCVWWWGPGHVQPAQLCCDPVEPWTRTLPPPPCLTPHHTTHPPPHPGKDLDLNSKDPRLARQQE
jgi:hypothetical protein